MSDETALVTKADLRHIEDGLHTVIQGMKRLREADDQILTVLANVDKRITVKVEDHEHRITRLEEVVA